MTTNQCMGPGVNEVDENTSLKRKKCTDDEHESDDGDSFIGDETNTYLEHPPSDEEPMNLTGGETTVTEQERAEGKPALSYIALIDQAIKSYPGGRATLGQICQYIRKNYQYYDKRYPKWQNSIRHNLSLNDCFMKISWSPNYWTVDPQEGIFQYK